MSPVPPAATPSVRRMVPEDVDRIYEIEVRSYPTPWPRESFEFELLDPRYAFCLVIEENHESAGGPGIVTGYICNWIVGDEMQVNNLAVHPDFLRRGNGERLLRAALAEGISRGAAICYLDVRRSNIQARNLYEKLGFRDVGVRKGYYRDSGEDAVVMSLPLGKKRRFGV